jgi:Tfp pilus assembly protein PilN
LRSFIAGVYPLVEKAEADSEQDNNMTAKTNLASRPFRNRSLPWTVAILIAMASFVGLLLIAKTTIQTNAQTQTAAAEVAKLQKQVSERTEAAKAIESALTTDQKQNLKSAHALIDRKRFSWALMLADLEHVLPNDVRVTRIAVKGVRVQDDRTVANLELVVGSKDPTNVTRMIEEMDQGGVFQAQLVSTNPQRGRGETGAEYELDVYYVPRASIPIDPGERNRRSVDTANPRGEPQ